MTALPPPVLRAVGPTCFGGDDIAALQTNKAGALRIDVATTRPGAAGAERGLLVVTFAKVQAFRVLDEGDLLRFWRAQDPGQSDVYEVLSHGWTSEAVSGVLDVASTLAPRLREWLVPTTDWCVNVLSFHEPALEWRPE